jgi:hypothetical protein
VLLSRQEAILISLTTTVKLLEWLLLARMLPCQLLTRSMLRAIESQRLVSIWCERAFQICVGLQSFRLSALQLCEILMHSFGALGSLILFHQWWVIATKVKHFRDQAV